MQSNNTEEKVPLGDGQQTYPVMPPEYTQQNNMPVQHVIVRQPALTDPPKDYLVQAILVTICCFWPTGIFAIIKAMDVQRASQMGDRDLATRSSASARKFVCISLWVGLACVVLSLIVCVLYVVFIINLTKQLKEEDYYD